MDNNITISSSLSGSRIRGGWVADLYPPLMDCLGIGRDILG